MSDITKKAIAAAFKQLLLRKKLSKITVADITELCGINRQTFYYHFQDIYDLVEWICVNDTEQVLKENKTYDTWQEGFLAVFELARKDKVFIDNIYHSVQLESLQQYLYRLVYPLLQNVVEEKAKNYVVREEDADFIAHFYKYAFVGLLLDWIKDGMREEPKKIIERVSSVVQGTVDQSLRSCDARSHKYENPKK